MDWQQFYGISNFITEWQVNWQIRMERNEPEWVLNRWIEWSRRQAWNEGWMNEVCDREFVKARNQYQWIMIIHANYSSNLLFFKDSSSAASFLPSLLDTLFQSAFIMFSTSFNGPLGTDCHWFSCIKDWVWFQCFSRSYKTRHQLYISPFFNMSKGKDFAHPSW